MTKPEQSVPEASTVPERVLNDLRRYLLQESLTIGDVRTSDPNGGEIRSGRAVLRGLDCAVEFYRSNDWSLLVLCAEPSDSWTFGECFPEIPGEESARAFFCGNLPKGFKEPLLSKIGLRDSVWVLISAANDESIKTNLPGILKQFKSTQRRTGTAKWEPGLNIFGKPQFGNSDILRKDDLFGTKLDDPLALVLPSDWDVFVQANVEYINGAPVLKLPIPLTTNQLSLGSCHLTELTVWLSAPMHCVRRAPDVCLTAKVKLNGTFFDLTANYPLDDDVIEAELKVKAGQPPPLPGLGDLLDLTKLNIEIAVGVSISKREVQRLLTERHDGFLDESRDVLRAGLETSPWVSVDDTGARHKVANGFCTQIGNDRFTWFGTPSSKSRLNFLDLLRAGHTDFVLNDTAFSYMRGHALPATLIARLAAQPDTAFADQSAWQAHLDRLGFAGLTTAPDPVQIATEGAIWGSIQAHGFLREPWY